jgi:diaminopimelate epimerase
MRLSKHHGLANDFLVVLDTSGDLVGRVDARLARAVCHRTRGIGADGLILGEVRGDGTLRMVLFNGDGSRAEISGNGIRCLAQAEAMRRGATHCDLVIDTDGGRRLLEVRPAADARTVSVSVVMGAVRPGPSIAAEPPVIDGAVLQRRDGTPTMGTGDIGNPHWVVLVDDARGVALATTGPRFEALVPGGVNVEFISVRDDERDAIDLTVWERGSGITEACGSGASVAATLAHRWGLVGTEVAVHMPGGAALVRLGDEVTLVGPSVHIADVDIDPDTIGRDWLDGGS